MPSQESAQKQHQQDAIVAAPVKMSRGATEFFSGGDFQQFKVLAFFGYL